MLKKILYTVTGLLAMIGVATAAGTFDHSYVKVSGQSTAKYSIAFSADGSGLLGVDTASFAIPIDGFVILATVNHGATACDDDFDILLLDEDGVDILGGAMLDLTPSTADTFQTAPTVGGTGRSRYVVGTATFSSSGNATADCFGVANFYWIK